MRHSLVARFGKQTGAARYRHAGQSIRNAILLMAIAYCCFYERIRGLREMARIYCCWKAVSPISK